MEHSGRGRRLGRVTAISLPKRILQKHPLTKGVLFWYNEGINKKRRNQREKADFKSLFASA
ncbi:MAG: hypothetical protein IIW07_04700, partial [Clostridia bacterium]|nr:hypothetical protein [Clostridia bacterium]